MDYRTAAREIGKGQVRPVYVCYGTETHMLREFIHYLGEKWLPPEDREFAISKYDLADTPLETVLEDAQTTPFIGTRKLIVADNALFFTGARDGGSGHATEALLAYLETPAMFSTTVFVVPADKLDERRKIVKAAQKHKAVVAFPALSPDDLAQWVRRQADRHQIRFADGAAEKLLLLCGGNTSLIATEIEKLALHAGAGGAVDEQAVEQLVSRTTEQNVFLLVDELAGLRLERALDIFYDLLKHREEPIKILALLAAEVRLMLLAKPLADMGLSNRDIAARLGVHPFRIKKAAEHARHFRLERLQQAVSRLADLDYRMKTGAIDKVLALELFMMELVS